MNIQAIKLAYFDELTKLNGHQINIILSIIINCFNGNYYHRGHLAKDYLVFSISSQLIKEIHQKKGLQFIKIFFDVHDESYSFHKNKKYSKTKAFVFTKKLESILSIYEKNNFEEIKQSIINNNKMNKIKINPERTGKAILHITDLYKMGNSKALEIYNDTYKPKEPLKAGDIFYYSRNQLYFRRNKLMLICQDVNWQEYKESRTGRLFQVDTSNFQNLNSELRKVVLGGMGYYDYDIENCHYSLLLQILEKNNINLTEFKVIRQYVRNKNKFRDNLSKEWNISTHLVKKILISLINGGAIKFGSLSFINLEKDTINKIFASDTYNKLKSELKKAKEYLLKVYDTIPNDIKTKLLAYILQGIESQILEVVDTKYKCILKIHDGWILDKNIPAIQISKFIEKETGFVLKIQKEEL